jgi:cobalt/nickel transport system permease protein
LHSWDPRFKIVSLVALIFVFASIEGPRSLLLVAVFALTAVLLSRIPLSFVLKTLRAPFVFLLIMTPILILTSGGEAILTLGFIRVYRAGIEAASRIGVKALSIMMLFIVLFGTSELNRTMKALESFRIPPALLAIFLFTYRYIFLYIEDMQKLFTAARLRGFSLQRGLKHIRISVDVLVALLIRSHEQSERVYAAMQLRGFTGSFQSLKGFESSPRDLLKTILTLGAGATVLITEILWT